MAVASSIIAAGIIAGASAGATAYSAHKQSEAQQEANDAQQQAGHEALDFQKQELEYEKELAAQKLAYDQLQQQKLEANQRQLATQLSPYVQLGSGALRNLGGLANVPMPAAGTPSGHPTSMAPGGNLGPGTPAAPAAPAPGQPPMGPPDMQSASLSSLAPNPAAFSSGYTLMEAPDGSGTRQVPANQVERLKALGAKVVS